MKYMGSKARFAKHILPIVLKGRKENQYYVEPFVGGGNMIDKVDGLRIGADFNKHVVAALEKIKNEPEDLPSNNSECSELHYHNVKNSDNYSNWIKGYFGFALSYGGKWFGGWCRDGKNERDYVAEAYRNALKQSPKLQGVEFHHSSYEDLEIPPNSIIYCDPPYANTTKYKTGEFNHDGFWQWCRERALEGHKIYISEYSAPADFVCVWEKETTSSLTKDTGSKTATEKLFKFGWVNY